MLFSPSSKGIAIFLKFRFIILCPRSATICKSLMSAGPNLPTLTYYPKPFALRPTCPFPSDPAIQPLPSLPLPCSSCSRSTPQQLPAFSSASFRLDLFLPRASAACGFFSSLPHRKYIHCYLSAYCILPGSCGSVRELQNLHLWRPTCGQCLVNASWEGSKNQQRSNFRYHPAVWLSTITGKWTQRDTRASWKHSPLIKERKGWELEGRERRKGALALSVGWKLALITGRERAKSKGIQFSSFLNSQTETTILYNN